MRFGRVRREANRRGIDDRDVPVGAIGILCIRRTLTEGRRIGFVSGLGAATADALYGAVAAVGLTSISSMLVAHQDAIRLVGGLVLCYLGVRPATVRPALKTAARSPPTLRPSH